MRCAVHPKRCVYKDCNETNDLMCIPAKKRKQILQKERVFVPQCSRACKYHFKNTLLNEFDLGYFNYTTDLVEKMVDLLRKTSPSDPEIHSGYTHTYKYDNIPAE